MCFGLVLVGFGLTNRGWILLIQGMEYRIFTAAWCAVLAAAVCLVGCGRRPQAEQPPADKLVVITPHNEDIKYEFDKAFSAYYQNQFGKPIHIEWRDIGSGSSAILRYLRNVYERSHTSGIDVLFGGGEHTFGSLAEEGLLERLELAEDVTAAIPATFGGMAMLDPDRRWCGCVLSSFGFLYNIRLLEAMGIPPPQTWEDLGRPELFGLVMLADPAQSGSVAAAYEMVVQSAPDWPSGWARLLAILSNAKQFADNSGGAANAPIIGDAPVAVCIDFIGTVRVAKTPDKLGYVSPRGQTGFTPDPVGILKSPPHPEAAQAFAAFVLSPRGQALWAMPPGTPGGTTVRTLGRTPIRRDFYTQYEAAQIPPWIGRPYAEGAEMKIDARLRQVRYGVLIQLVQAAAIDNLSGMRQAKRRLIESGFEPLRLAAFNRLPENVDTVEEIEAIAIALKDKAALEQITAEWTRFFRKQYKKVSQ